MSYAYQAIPENFSRWSNNGAGGERRYVGGWLGVAIKRGMESSMDEDIKHFSVPSCSLVKPPDPVFVRLSVRGRPKEILELLATMGRRRPFGIVAVGSIF